MKNIKLFEEFIYEETSDFGEVAEWVQEIYEWDYVEQEGDDRIRFDWRNGQLSFWLNSDMTGEGNLPSSIKSKIVGKGVKLPVNESLFGNIARLGVGSRKDTKGKLLGRQDDDNFAIEIYNEMVKDFEANGKDLKKVMMMGDHKIHYVFGPYDKINNSPMTGNKQVGNKDITVTYIAPELLLKPNSLEKHFGVSRGLKLAKGYMQIEEWVENPDYNPNYHPDFKTMMGGRMSDSERNMMRMYDVKEERFNITYDLAKDFVDFFKKEYNKQYPELKKAKYRNLMSIGEIEKGKKPNLGYVDEFDKNHKEIIYPYDDLKDKKKILNYIKNNVCVNGKSKEDYPVTYFTKEGETVKEVEKKMKGMTKAEIVNQNKERYSK